MDKGLLLISLFLLIPSSSYSSTWSSWSSWGECSRTCGGGVMSQTRKCFASSRQLCAGKEIMYKMCNQQSCPPSSRDFLSEQCSAYDDTPYNGQHYIWVPSQNKHDPCALICQPAGTHGREHIVIFASKVIDGTRCHEHSTDVCVNGSCKKAGCDMVIDSGSVLDHCGVCGGDGSTCSELYHRDITATAKQTFTSVTNNIPVIKPYDISLSVDSLKSGESYSKTHKNSLIKTVNKDFVLKTVKSDKELLTNSNVNNNSRLISNKIAFKNSNKEVSNFNHNSKHESNVKGSEYLQNDDASIIDNRISITNDAYSFLGRSKKIQDTVVIKLGAVEVQLYEWQESSYSSCSVTCGHGMQQTMMKCVNMKTGDVSPDQFCHLSKPPHRAKTCILKACHAKWIASKWRDCSATCGGGVSERNLFCVRAGAGGKIQKTEETECLKQRPPSKQTCNERPCPQWEPGQWSKCSVTCGAGDQYRTAVCKKKIETDICPPNNKPTETQKCHTGVLCIHEIVVDHEVITVQKPIILENPDKNNNNIIKEDEEYPVVTEDNRGGDAFGNENQQALERPNNGQIYWDKGNNVIYDNGDDDPGDYYRGNFDDVDSLYSVDEESNNEINGRDPPFKGGESQFSYNWRDYRGNDVMEMDREEGSGEVTSPGIISEDPSYMTGPWSACDVTCGHGHRHRQVTCKALIAYSNTVEIVDESLCIGVKKASTEECIEQNCPIHITDGVSTQGYGWKMAGWQPCSVTCGGGLKEPIFECVRADPTIHVTVTKDLCSRLPLTQVIKESCNNFACPAAVFRALEPRWRVMDYGACSHRCGGGISQRQVNCVRNVVGSVATRELAVPDELCSETRPAGTKLCNLVRCPPQWTTGDFTNCNVTCGKGAMIRNSTCQQIIPPNRDVVTINEAFCQKSSQPTLMIPCEREPCIERAHMKPDRTHYVQLQPRKQLRFVAGGTLVIIPGTVLRIRCPVSNFDKVNIVWTKDRDVVSRKGRVKRSKRGVLLIRGAENVDDGVYICQAGKLSATTLLSLHTEREALEKYILRDQANARDPEFIDLFHKTLKLSGSHRKEEYTEPYLLKHFDSPDILPLKFIAEQWGPCSRNCGGAGLQNRQVTCELNLDQYYIVLNDDYCLDKGFDKPLSTKDCGFQVCPEWEVGVWSNECSDAKCLDYGIGAKTRPLYCVTYSGSLLDLNMCDRRTRPEDHLGCAMDSCIPTWTTSDWTSCSRSCGGEGIRTRSLQCIWVPNKRPANGACQEHAKPDVMKPCQTPACDDNYCQDESNYCSLVQMLNLCRYSEYRTKCCASCTAIGRGPIRMNRYRLT